MDVGEVSRAPAPADDGRKHLGGTLELVASLCRVLEQEHVAYCHWKSNEALDRSASGENDLDLLVHRPDSVRFEEILRRLGFRDAQPPGWKRLPGLYHAYGVDGATGRLVHIHAHYQLIVGDDMTKNYHLPIEEPYLASSVDEPPFKVPAPRFELAVFVVRMVLKHCAWDAIVSFQGSLASSERRELTYLLGRVDADRGWDDVAPLVPFVPSELWQDCLRAVQPGSGLVFRVGTARRLQRALSACARRPMAADTTLKMWRRARTVVRRKVLRRGPITTRLTAGGALVAVVGGDGAGKSTVVGDLSTWLSRDVWTARVHLGRPRWSFLTYAMKGAMRLAASSGGSPGPSPSALKDSLSSAEPRRLDVRSIARLVWVVLTARDRYRTYARARRLATNGAVVLCDRYPLPEVGSMDGPIAGRATGRANGRVVSALARLERRYYDRISPPDVLIVLRVDPDVAAARRVSGDESILRRRSEEISSIDWSQTSAIVIDAGRPKAEVAVAARSSMWSKL